MNHDVQYSEASFQDYMPVDGSAINEEVLGMVTEKVQGCDVYANQEQYPLLDTFEGNLPDVLGGTNFNLNPDLSQNLQNMQDRAYTGSNDILKQISDNIGNVNNQLNQPTMSTGLFILIVALVILLLFLTYQAGFGAGSEASILGMLQ